MDTLSKSFNCYNNQKNGQEITSDWAKKKNYGNFSICAYSETIAR